MGSSKQGKDFLASVGSWSVAAMLLGNKQHTNKTHVASSDSPSVSIPIEKNQLCNNNHCMSSNEFPFKDYQIVVEVFSGIFRLTNKWKSGNPSDILYEYLDILVP